MTTERPLWETEPTELDFEADGLPCAMRRNRMGVWCGYVGVGPDHPLYGLPTNHPLKLPSSWFDGRRGLEGTGVLDLFAHALEGHKSIEDACPISMALQVHSGCNFAADRLSGRDPDERYWWFGFDCGHAGDFVPRMPGMEEVMRGVIAAMPEHVRDTMRGIMAKQATVYRDQQYVVAECQSLAAQLNAIVRVLERENVNGNVGPDHRRG